MSIAVEMTCADRGYRTIGDPDENLCPLCGRTIGDPDEDYCPLCGSDYWDWSVTEPEWPDDDWVWYVTQPE